MLSVGTIMLAGGMFAGTLGCTQAPAQSESLRPAPAVGQDRNAVVATIDGKPITASELDKSVAPGLAKLEEQAYELKRDHLERIIAERLLAAEAARRGITVDALVKAEIADKVPPVTDGDVGAFVEANRARIPGDPSGLTNQIRGYIENQRRQERRSAFLDSLRERSKVEVKLPPPPPYRAPVATDGAPARGLANARVTVVEFSDFHCPYCRRVQPTLNALLAKYPNDVRLVYKHFPLDELHPQARRASEASWCAQQQDKFWQFHDRLYAGGSDAAPATLAAMAQSAGIDVATFESCLVSGKAASAVERDAAEGARFGVTGTPGFFINGRLLSGNLPLDRFVEIVEEELGRR
jgi:protein-disulfide isomerase